MNTARIQNAIREIELNTSALKWLEQYGPQFTGREESQASVTVHLNLASACFGAKEAASVLSAFARLSLPQIIELATHNCRNTIAMAESAIREEAGAEA